MLTSKNPENMRLLDNLVLKTIDMYGSGCTLTAIVDRFQIGREPILESVWRLVESEKIDFLGEMHVKAKGK